MTNRTLLVDKDKRFRCPECHNHVCRHTDQPPPAKPHYVCHACELDWPVLD